jgi:metal-responsive CopG/Arc/MetJ family transcriptional regulator
MKAESINTYSYESVHMSTQISLKLSDKMFKSANKYADTYGYDNLQDFIRELLREHLFEPELSGREMALASEASLAKRWSTKQEEKAWAHLQKEK